MRIRSILVAVFCFAIAAPALADKYTDAISNFKKAEVAKPYFASAYGYAVFPTIGKGGVGVGAAAGKGRVYQGGRYVGDSTLMQLSVGFQLGGQAYSQIVFFEDKRAFDEFTNDSFEFGADASAVAVTLGANAQAGTTGPSASVSTTVDNGKAITQYYKGFAVLTLAKGGLMYQAAIAGQKYVFKRK